MQSQALAVCLCVVLSVSVHYTRGADLLTLADSQEFVSFACINFDFHASVMLLWSLKFHAAVVSNFDILVSQRYGDATSCGYGSTVQYPFPSLGYQILSLGQRAKIMPSCSFTIELSLNKESLFCDAAARVAGPIENVDSISVKLPKWGGSSAMKTSDPLKEDSVLCAGTMNVSWLQASRHCWIRMASPAKNLVGDMLLLLFVVGLLLCGARTKLADLKSISKQGTTTISTQTARTSLVAALCLLTPALGRAFCRGNQVFTSTHGTFSDGSGDSNYQNDAHCSWTIAPPGSGTLEIIFTEFAVEFGWDFVVVYSCGNKACSSSSLALIQVVLEPETVSMPVSADKAVMVEFISDESVTLEGFTAEWNFVDFFDPSCNSTLGMYPFQGECVSCSGQAPENSVMSGIDACHWVCGDGYTGPDGGPCTACTPGSYKEVQGSGPCTACQPGSFKRDAGLGSCVSCATGSHSEVGASSCTPCKLGTYKRANNPAGCTLCPPGSFTTTNGSSFCSVCPLGTFLSASLDAGAECRACPMSGRDSSQVNTSSNCTENSIFISPQNDWKASIQDAPHGSTVLLFPGLYTGECNVQIRKNITLLSVSGKSETVLDCQQRNRHFYVTGATFSMHGLTLTNGNSHSEGGGCVLVGGKSSVSISGSSLSVCNTLSNGGVIKVTKNSALVLSDETELRSGSAGALGGGVFLEDESLLATARNVYIVNNEASGRGGGVYSSSSSVVDLREGTEIRDCSAVDYGGGVFLRGSTLRAEGNVSIVGNEAGQSGGGVFGLSSSVVDLRDGTEIRDCIAIDDGGGVWLQQSTLRAEGNVSIMGNEAGDNGGGIYGILSVVDLREGTEIRDCSAVDYGGGVYLQGSTLRAEGNVSIVGNEAGQSGGGVFGLSSSVVDLRDGTEIRDCIAIENGGGVWLQQSTLRAEGNVSIMGNEAGQSGGGIHGGLASAVDLRESTQIRGCIAMENGGGVLLEGGSTLSAEWGVSIVGNEARQHGGGICGLASMVDLREGTEIRDCSAVDHGGSVYLQESMLRAEGHVSIVGNEAKFGSGGGIYGVAASVIDLQEGTDMQGCVAATHGGGIFLLEQSILKASRAEFHSNRAPFGDGGTVHLSDSSAEVIDCTFRRGSSLGDGGCISAEGDSVVIARDSSFDECLAGAAGGALAVRSQSTATLEGRMVFTRNSAQEGGGIFAQGLEQGFSGGTLTVQNNRASDRGGGIASWAPFYVRNGSARLSNNHAEIGGGWVGISHNSVLSIGADANLVVENCTAEKDGGGIALLDLAAVVFDTDSEPCPRRCFTARSCRTGGECLTAQCNFNGEACKGRFEDAGLDSLQACDRDKCDVMLERWDASCGNGGDCLVASCDWAEDSQPCRRVLDSLASCPLFDAVVYDSILRQGSTLMFVQEGGTANGFGRCANSTCQLGQNGFDTYEWCETIDDGGRVLEQRCEGCGSPYNDVGQSWGVCSPGRPRLPSAGFDYDGSVLLELLDTPVEDIMQQFPGCGRNPLRVLSNQAGRMGGGLYSSGCYSLQEGSGVCFIGHIPIGFEPSLMVLFQGNSAAAGAGIFSACQELGGCSGLMDKHLGLPSRDKAYSSILEFRDNVAAAYGDRAASTANKLIVVETNRVRLVPGQDTLNVTLQLLDSIQQHIDGRVDPYVIQMLVCATSAGCSSASSFNLQPVQLLAYEGSQVRTAEHNAVIQNCPSESNSVTVQLTALTRDQNLEVTVGIECLPCRHGQSRTNISGTQEHAGRVLWSCESCSSREYVIDPNRHSCTPCPVGATCDGSTLHPLVFGSTWVPDHMDGIFRLISCPLGYMLLNVSSSGVFSHDAQMCRQCAVGLEYIIDPNRHECKACPIGAMCDGMGLIPKVQGSVWKADPEHGIYRLTACPTGHRVVNTTSDGSFAQALQECTPCPPGSECAASVCEECLLCSEGFFKTFSGTATCEACQANTYNPDKGASAISQCVWCPAKSSTRGLGGQSSRDACICDDEYYEAVGSEDSECVKCPKAGLCEAEGLCLLRGFPEVVRNCSDGGGLVGEWKLDTGTGRYLLESCPTGHELLTAVEAGSDELQECKRCIPGQQYILDPNVDECQTCPRGLKCFGTGQVEPVVEGSIWTRDGPIFRLHSCPTNYRVMPAAGDVFDQASQRCEPCGKGLECTHAPCVTCSACPAGSYKDFSEARSCSPCPANTFGASQGAEALALCESCPARSTTGGLDNQTSEEACICDEDRYLIVVNSQVAGHTKQERKCQVCPNGAVCAVDLSCALANADLACTDGTVVVGDWELQDGDRPGGPSIGEYLLVSCPMGYKLVRNFDGVFSHNSQRCEECADGYFIANSTDPDGQCQKCPPGLKCYGKGPPRDSPVISGEFVLGGLTPGYRSANDEEAIKRAILDSMNLPPGTEIFLTFPDYPVRRRRHAFRRSAGMRVEFDIVGNAIGAKVLWGNLTQALMARFEPLGFTLTGPVAVADADLTVGTFDIVNGELRMRACPEGYLLINSPFEEQTCKPCGPSTYSFHYADGCETPDFRCPDRECQACPNGAICSGRNSFTPKINGSAWVFEELEENEKVYQRMRLHVCPSGYVLVRSDEFGKSLQDECVPCPANRYSVAEVRYGDESTKGLVTAAATNARTLCIECPENAICNGTNHLQPKVGYWLHWDDRALVDERRVPALGGPKNVTIYRCGLNSCKGGTKSECEAGREGPVCGLCIENPRHALSGTKCEPCSVQGPSAQWTALAMVLVLFMVAWYYLSWQPYFAALTEDDVDEARNEGTCLGSQRIGRIVNPRWRTFKEKVLGLIAGYLDSDITDYVKIFISFWQVVSTYAGVYGIPWPDELSRMWEYAAFLRFDWMQMPGLGCVASGVSYLTVLQVSTLMPLIVSLMLGTPALILFIRRQTKTDRFGHVSNYFWYFLMFWLFLIYPYLAALAVEGFSCRYIGQTHLLTSDLSVECPLDSLSSPTFLWVLLATSLYPLGIPLFMYWILHKFNVPTIARRKINNATLHQMLALYSRETSKTLSAQIAAFVGAGSKDSNQAVLLERAEMMFNKAGNGALSIEYDSLVTYLSNIGVEGHLSEEIQELMILFDDNGNGTLEFPEFLELIKQIVKHSNLISGHETFETLDETQLELLCRVRWHDFIDEDVGESSGLKRELKKKLQKQQDADNARELQRLQRELRERGKEDGTSFTLRQASPIAAASSNIKKLNSSSFKNMLALSASSSRGQQQQQSEEGGGEGMTMPGAGSGTTSWVEPPQLLEDNGVDEVYRCNLGPNAPAHQKREWLLKMGRHMLFSGAIALPVLRWDGAADEEILVTRRVGFLFDSYRVQYWYFELVEMSRKFVMSALVTFLYPGSPQQLAGGLLINTTFLMVFLKISPYASTVLDNMQAFSLTAQSATLFYGLVLALQSLVQQAGNVEEAVMKYVVLFLNCTILILPVWAIMSDPKKQFFIFTKFMPAFRCDCFVAVFPRRLTGSGGTDECSDAPLPRAVERMREERRLSVMSQVFLQERRLSQMQTQSNFDRPANEPPVYHQVAEEWPDREGDRGAGLPWGEHSLSSAPHNQPLERTSQPRLEPQIQSDTGGIEGHGGATRPCAHHGGVDVEKPLEEKAYTGSEPRDQSLGTGGKPPVILWSGLTFSTPTEREIPAPLSAPGPSCAQSRGPEL